MASEGDGDGGGAGPGEVVRVGEYVLAIEGFAMLRRVLRQPSAARARVAEVQAVVGGFDAFPYDIEIPLLPHEVADGYTRWAPTYDGPNPAIAVEQPIVHELLVDAPRGRALDAACGTGRHAAHLASLGYEVVGVDATAAMLDRAREKLPGADLRVGTLEDLPVEEGSVDLVTCALALTHVPDLQPVMAELARVLRPGGEAVLSDMHPLTTITGGIAGFPSSDITEGIPYVPNLTHHVSEYLAAFRRAGLDVVDCREPLADEEVVRRMPTYAIHPEATRDAFGGLPFLLIWRLRKRA